MKELKKRKQNIAQKLTDLSLSSTLMVYVDISQFQLIMKIIMKIMIKIIMKIIINPNNIYLSRGDAVLLFPVNVPLGLDSLLYDLDFPPAFDFEKPLFSMNPNSLCGVLFDNGLVCVN